MMIAVFWNTLFLYFIAGQNPEALLSASAHQFPYTLRKGANRSELIQTRSAPLHTAPSARWQLHF